jgi:cytochrome c-type biogenesis protein CcmH/NrfF
MVAAIAIQTAMTAVREAFARYTDDIPYAEEHEEQISDLLRAACDVIFGEDSDPDITSDICDHVHDMIRKGETNPDVLVDVLDAAKYPG